MLPKVSNVIRPSEGGCSDVDRPARGFRLRAEMGGAGAPDCRCLQGRMMLVTIQGVSKAYRAAPTVSPVAHSPCPQLHAIAGRFSGVFAIRSTIFAALCYRAIAPRMSALLGLLFGHDKPPLPLLHYHTQELEAMADREV